MFTFATAWDSPFLPFSFKNLYETGVSNVINSHYYNLKQHKTKTQ